LQEEVATILARDQLSERNKRVRVALVDSGVNYLLPQINQRLARDASNSLIGYDYWDLDPLPFDAHPTRSAFFVQRHGTRTASLLLNEAPNAELVVYRYPRPDMSRMRALIAHADEHGVSIVAMPLGGQDAEQWQVFYETARQHPHILFIASAGNDGRDLDQYPVFPAALDLDNMLVVTSADDFIRPAERTNWSVTSVDYMLPAELRVVTDFNGQQTFASGSSYAVSRLAALAANLKNQFTDLGTQALKNAIQKHYSIKTERAYVALGYIPDPLAALYDAPEVVSEQRVKLTSRGFENQLDLDLLVLDTRWRIQRVTRMLKGVFEIMAECRIDPGQISVKTLRGPNYTKHLSVGSAFTVLGPNPKMIATVVLADNTHMLEAYEAEAFGLGNTRTRPWLRNTVWLTQSVQHEELALAHELYHVVANDGQHQSTPNNLMQAQTTLNNVELNDNQCARLLEIGHQNRLLSSTR